MISQLLNASVAHCLDQKQDSVSVCRLVVDGRTANTCREARRNTKTEGSNDDRASLTGVRLATLCGRKGQPMPARKSGHPWAFLVKPTLLFFGEFATQSNELTKLFNERIVII